jgi:hypothetical protein
MSTAFYPQTDGQAEKANGIVERYLRTFAADNERRWDRLLGLAEFSYNSHVHKATGMTPFEADIAENPRMPLDVMAAASRHKPGGETIAVGLATKMNDILHRLTDSLKVTQAAMTEEANKKRQSHDFQPGDSVFVNTRHFPLGHANAAGDVINEEKGARLSRALQQRFMGPHKLVQARGENAFELDLPGHLRASRTRNVGEFKRDQVDYARDQAPPPPVRVTKAGQSEYEIEKILNWRENEDHKAEFKVKWLGWDAEEDNTWEPLTNITRYGGKDIFRAYVTAENSEALYRLVPKTYRPAAKKKRRKKRG